MNTQKLEQIKRQYERAMGALNDAHDGEELEIIQRRVGPALHAYHSICWPVGKRRYPSREAANLRSHQLRNYRCEFCGDWHVTSQERD